MANGRVAGTVKWFNPTKGYGFIIPSDKSDDVFLHMRNLPPGTKELAEGQAITFELAPTKKGVQAINVVLG